MKRMLFVFAAAAVIVTAAPSTADAQYSSRQVRVDVQRTSLSRDQEIQIGKQAAAQVERESEIIHNPEIEAWLNQIGQRLAKTPQARDYPYYFKLVNDDSINAFALPGGPMYVNTGLIKAADNEGEVAGVLAHEMSHVALRHGAAQISKQQTYGALFGILGAAAGTFTSGQNGECGFLCQMSQLGVGIGAGSVLMKFSRGYERDADLNGARMMAAAGYDPIELPRFFEKLQAKQGTAGEPRGLGLWLASHPATGSRIQYVQQDIRFYPQHTYNASTGEFSHIKKLVAVLPPPIPQPGKLIQLADSPTPRANLPEGYKDYPANGFSIAYPSHWQAGQPESASSLYIVPQGGAVKGQNGGTELLLGAMIDYYVPKAGASKVQLAESTAEFIDALEKGDTNLKAGKPTPTTVGGHDALVTHITTKTSLKQEPDQIVYLYTVPRQSGLWYLVLATMPSVQKAFDPIARAMVQSVIFPSEQRPAVR
ncbi:MAG: M48 family metalloprotease [Acidobacteriota bacterium]|nr:M48 family metalloprotease [Acidobacteriota bacterium]